MHYLREKIAARSLFAFYICFVGLLTRMPAHAGVVIDGTRQIYPAQSREITIKLTNADKNLPRLVKVWLADGDGNTTAEQSDVPFTITPPVFRMEPDQTQSLRVVYAKEPLPTDRESLFWLNVLEMPPDVHSGEDTNRLRFAFRIRSKLFFRPEGLAGRSEDAPAQLIWSLVKASQGRLLEVRNPSPYYVSFQSVALLTGDEDGARTIQSDQYEMVAPGGTQQFLLREAVGVASDRAQVEFSVVSDFGAFSAPIRAPLLL
ncbi:molecular chaperone [Collimonas sp. NPDC087041]|uniref:fimbrial biogenesis chaperone n=1 Tax=Collimonas sp. NPDC087041 TaxID=3363960 RepID=UPI00381121F3